MPAVIVVGLQWGDEGKGKVVDLLSSKAHAVVRSQGGCNAGHTVVHEGKEFKFHHIPSGSLYPHILIFLAGGLLLDPDVFQAEIEGLKKNGVDLEGRLRISPYIHLVLPLHKELDGEQEALRGKNLIGTTKRGIGPAAADRAARYGVRITDLFDKKTLTARLEALFTVHGKNPGEVEKEVTRLEAVGRMLEPYLAAVEREISQIAIKGGSVLLEGAHGILLDNFFGSYPFVTSSATLAAGVCAGAGIGPTLIDHTVGVVKAYATRVGSGPFPTELEEGESIATHEDAREIGTTTGRKRRMGWFDVPLARYAAQLNSVDSLAIMKLDVLDNCPTIKICTGYAYRGRHLDFPPSSTEAWDELEPVYEEMRGWMSPTRSITNFTDLPEAAQRYVERLAEHLDVPLSLVSVGPDRSETIHTDAYIPLL